MSDHEQRLREACAVLGAMMPECNLVVSRTDLSMILALLADLDAARAQTMAAERDLARVTEEQDEWRHAAQELTSTCNRVADQRDAIAAKLARCEATVRLIASSGPRATADDLRMHASAYFAEQEPRT